jgi:hypothetical protein
LSDLCVCTHERLFNASALEIFASNERNQVMCNRCTFPITLGLIRVLRPYETFKHAGLSLLCAEVSNVKQGLPHALSRTDVQNTNLLVNSRIFKLNDTKGCTTDTALRWEAVKQEPKFPNFGLKLSTSSRAHAELMQIGYGSCSGVGNCVQSFNSTSK